jgi:cysteine desulfurase / selenocysteine lyase
VAPQGRSPRAATAPSDRTRAYFDHASVGLLTPTARRRAVEALDLQAAEGSTGAAAWNPLVNAARERVARLVGASPGDIAFAKNTPEAISRVASGLRWRAGDRVAVPDCEFPANVYPWLNLRRLGVEVDWIRTSDGAIDLGGVERALRARTRLLAVSWVQFASGARVDLAAIAELCARRDVLLLVDAIQAIGVVPLDVRTMRVDFVATASHKWLGAPLGAGWLYVRPERLPDLDLHEVGQATVRPRPTFTDYLFDPHPDARRFESGVVPVVPLAGLGGALEDLERLGIGAVGAAVRTLTAELMAGLERRGHRLITPRDDEGRAGIVAFAPRDGTAAAFVARAAEHGCVLAAREGWVRVAVHASNTPAEVERLLALA